MSNYEVIYSDELQHHGVLGMKWGIRKYQNEDGSLTPAGRKRYGEDLDITDKSRKNVAKIRLGEARRRLDVAKNNSETKGKNDYRVAEMQQRVKAAKKEVKKQGLIDKGANLSAKGRTITGNAVRRHMAYGAAYLATKAVRQGLNTRLSDLGKQGILSPAHNNFAKVLDVAAEVSIAAVTAAYISNNYRQNTAMRAYNRSRYGGESTLNRVGSQEYKDVVERRKKNS